MPRGDSYERGILEGRGRVLQYLSVCIDTWPEPPSDTTVVLLTGGQIDMSDVHRALERFAEKLAEEKPRRKRRPAVEAPPEEGTEPDEAVQ
jgi:hypothetical protein